MKNPTFDQVYACLQKHGPAVVISVRGTKYEVWAELRKGRPTIVGYPASSQVVIHDDCWGDSYTCQGTRAGGIFNGDDSIYAWYARECKK